MWSCPASHAWSTGSKSYGFAFAHNFKHSMLSKPIKYLLPFQTNKWMPCLKCHEHNLAIAPFTAEKNTVKQEFQHETPLQYPQERCKQVKMLNSTPFYATKRRKVNNTKHSQIWSNMHSNPHNNQHTLLHLFGLSAPWSWCHALEHKEGRNASPDAPLIVPASSSGIEKSGDVAYSIHEEETMRRK